MRIPTGYPPPPHMAYPGPYGYHPVYYGYTPYLPYAVSFVHCVYLKEHLIASAEYSFISKYCDVAKECLPLKEYPPPTFDPISYGGSKFNSIQKKNLLKWVPTLAWALHGLWSAIMELLQGSFM